MDLSKEFQNKYIRTFGGKDLIFLDGLVELAKLDGLSEIRVKVLQFPCTENGNTAICSCTAKANSITCTEVAEAVPTQYVASNEVVTCAASRAKARALRLITGLNMLTAEEIMNQSWALKLRAQAPKEEMQIKANIALNHGEQRDHEIFPLFPQSDIILPTWNKNDLIKLNSIMTALQMKSAEELDPYIAIWSKQVLTSHTQLKQENIKAFIKYIQKKATIIVGEDKLNEIYELYASKLGENVP